MEAFKSTAAENIEEKEREIEELKQKVKIFKSQIKDVKKVEKLDRKLATLGEKSKKEVIQLKKTIVKFLFFGFTPELKADLVITYHKLVTIG